MSTLIKTLKKTGFRPSILSRHPSHDVLRGKLTRLPFRSVIRFGSTTPHDAPVQLNIPEAVQNSSSKLRMKRCFEEGQVRTAKWCWGDSGKDLILSQFDESYPVVAKSLFGSRGKGNSLLHSKEELSAFIDGRDIKNYIFEKFHNYSREYRLHVTEDGCFYTCRKMLKTNAPKDVRWFRNDSNCIWAVEDNENFDKPVNWDEIVTECVKALKSCKLDFGACDLRVQTAKDKDGKVRKQPDFIVVEINSAPSFGEITSQKYMEILPELLLKKSQK